MTSIMRVMRATHLAARWHVDQRRKGAAAEPYVNHLLEVADLVAQATDGADDDLVIAALLHDAVEDVGVTRAQIADLFGPAVADLVAEVTDDKALPKADRKRMQVETTPHKSARARMIKLADKTSNLRALAASPPADWPPERKAGYLAWARSVTAGARGVNARLEAAFDEAALELERRLAA